MLARPGVIFCCYILVVCCFTIRHSGLGAWTECYNFRDKFRVGESAYFGCKDPAAVLDDGSGMRVFTLPCPIGLNFNVTWPKCILEPVCDSFPVPPASTGLDLATNTSSVLLGNYINYECTRRSEFYETTTVIIMQQP